MPPPTKSIVLLDDEKSYTDLMTQLLAEGLSCPVHGFTRPLDALRALPEIRPSVVVTDYSMPQINGIEFIRQAAPLAPGAVFVIITGNDLSEWQDELDQIAVLKGLLPKPFGWLRLAHEILRVWPEGLAAPFHPANFPRD